MDFHLVNDAVPEISRQIIRDACREREINYIEHDSRRFVFEPARKVAPGNILFRPAVSQAAMRVEQFLYNQGVATFYRGDWGLLSNCNNSLQRFESCGLPIPRSFYLNQSSRESLDYYVEQLGGFPVVLKVLGHSSGIGVMKLENKPSLYSVVDYITAGGHMPVLSTFINDAVHWRCIVVGDRVIAAYINPQEKDDFRTYGSTDAKDIFTEVDDALSEIAVAAVEALDNEFGGVDILQHASGRCYLLECNFPCYYAHAQEHGGVDVAGKMVDYLAAKASSV